MESWLLGMLSQVLAWLSLPDVGLPAVFLVAFVSATLLPMGSEPAVLALVTARPELFWPAVGVATLGNTVGGMVSWWMGRAAARARDRWRQGADPAEPAGPADRSGSHVRAQAWLQRWGPRACLLSWLPVVGDPLCAVAGWLNLPAAPCALYMALGKGLRYVGLTLALQHLL
ncbi:MAG: hypothetical protein RLZZ182_752 [Pseudomonadota bacterium]